MLGISSYVIVYSLLSLHVIELSSICDFLGWTSQDLERYKIDLNSKIVTFAVTVAIVKSLDIMGLVPLRWALTILLTPYVARLIGPALDKIVLYLKSIYRK